MNAASAATIAAFASCGPMSGTSARRLSSAGLRTSNVGTPRWGGGPINSARGDPRLGKFKLRLLVTRHSMSLRAVPRWQAGSGAAGRSERHEQIGRAHVLLTVSNAHLVCRLLFE